MHNNIPRPELPRPDFAREQWINLNGEWDFEFDDLNVGEENSWYINAQFTRKIVVPFVYQCKMSGINEQDIHKNIWYKKEFILPESMYNKNVFLNFGAVDYIAKVWINGTYLGLHEGGYTPFKFNIAKYLKPESNVIIVKVEDKNESMQPKGKQHCNEKIDRCWYTPTSGIWQTVWLEATGENSIEQIRFIPDIDRRQVTTEILLDSIGKDIAISIELYFNDTVITTLSKSVSERNLKFTIDIHEKDFVDEIHYWSPESPNLYDVHFKLTQNGIIIDKVKSYFGMRKISVEGDLILLNNRPYYQRLVLDQGYWPDTLITPPSDEAIILDIELTKKMGFNGARKHQKIEDPRYYYWADKLGLLVWGEMPSAYEFCTDEIENIIRDWTEFLKRDYNHPSIIMWVPFNESWGIRNIIADKNQQNFAVSLYHITHAFDGSRLVSTNDGWEMVTTDIYGIHDYELLGEAITKKYNNIETLFKNAAWYKMLLCKGYVYENKPIIITEYGGIAYKSDYEGGWGYYDIEKDEQTFLNRFQSTTSAIKKISLIRGYCYTQLTDVQQEINGLLTDNRQPKIDINKIRSINEGSFE